MLLELEVLMKCCWELDIRFISDDMFEASRQLDKGRAARQGVPLRPAVAAAVVNLPLTRW